MKQEKNLVDAFYTQGGVLNFNQQLTMYHGENYFEVAPKSQKYSDLAKYFQNIQFLPMAQYAVQGEAILVTRFFFSRID